MSQAPEQLAQSASALADALAQHRDSLFAQMLSKLACAIFLVDRGGRILWVNSAFCSLTGYETEELIGRTPSLLRSGEQDKLFYSKLWATILAGDPWRGEVVNRRRDGSLYTAEEIITPLQGPDGRMQYFVALQIDLAPRQLEHNRQRYLAFNDALTQLPNRNQVDEQLAAAIARHEASGLRFALMFLDLDRFKAVNDSFGHHIGDLLLVAVAHRLTSAIRASDIVMRQGGDEFLIIAGELQQLGQAQTLAEQLIETLSQPFMLAGHQILVGASIGIAYYPDDGSDVALLLQRADLAMYAAKSAGRGCAVRYQGSS
ncbi:diguanylate cyclase domain-containing protein [Chitinimonas sp.]|uniref:diguanylate cyclase domain-containing protein n=1 Tax=Chitinimonas sp. TaxID=1934313 RepID=UPI002F92A6EE